MHSRTSGFSLLEVIIGLAIASFATLALLDAVRATSVNSARTSEIIAKQIEFTLTELPLRRAIENSVPGYYDKPEKAMGDEFEFQSQTAIAAQNTAVTLQPYRIAIDATVAKTTLQYWENGTLIFEIEIPQNSRFTYQDDVGNEYPEWPPSDGLRDNPIYFIPLPSKIIITGDFVVTAYSLQNNSPIPLRVSDYNLVL